MISNISTQGKRNPHPFPARMAPGIALAKITDLSRPGSVVLDPMCGSGTVPRVAGALRRKAIGADVDPLAVTIARTACKPHLSNNLTHKAKLVVDEALSLKDQDPVWFDKCPETKTFAEYWFAREQYTELSRLARVLATKGRSYDALRSALSRTIVTKSVAASLARDTSHSRPHRVTLTNDYDVMGGFVKAAHHIERSVSEQPESDHRSWIRRSDARSLSFIPRKSVDLVVCSPPYLNAIDYLRGHRLSLIWLGWTIKDLRSIRGDSVGSERKLLSPLIASELQTLIPDIEELSGRDSGMIVRFAHDMQRFCQSMSRVSKRNGHMVLVLADSTLRNVAVPNSSIASWAAESVGFRLVETLRRPLPDQHRYLPPPSRDKGSLGGRMKEELILTFQCAT
nr:DNA methyltransferase [Mycolicibacterium sp. BK556]